MLFKIKNISKNCFKRYKARNIFLSNSSNFSSLNFKGFPKIFRNELSKENKNTFQYKDCCLNYISSKNFTNIIIKNENNNPNSINKNSKLFSMIKTILDTSFTNKYNGVIVDIEKIYEEINYNRKEENFEEIIKELVSIWTHKIPKSSITIKIPIKHIFLTEYFLNQNFTMHHCTKNDITLCLWLTKNIEDKIPKYCHSLVGIGSVIYTKENKLLLIRERYSNYNIIKWKFVTGLNDHLENIFDTCLREAKEETNLKINYHGVICFAEFFPSLYNSNEICFFNLCSINAYEDEIRKKIIIDTNELSEVEFFNKEKLNKLIEKKEVTVFTEKVLNKILTSWDESKSLEENVDFMIKNKLILSPKGHENEMDNRFKSFKFYS